jgi:ribosomal protein S20
MTKKQKNRKIVSQNLRNKSLNRRYTSLIKFLFKSLKTKILTIKKKNLITDYDKKEILLLEQKLESLFDKSVTKKVLHKNTSSRKKSRLKKFIKKEIFSLLC